MTIEQIEIALKKSWTRETSFCPDEWSEENPARGQCMVSALVIQDLLSGDLKRYRALLAGLEEKHYVNVLIDGQVVDVTREQYPASIEFEESEPSLHGFMSIREKLLADAGTKRRYELLQLRVMALLREYLEVPPLIEVEPLKGNHVRTH
jgi:hypothetical protein